jgi:hypothetical protein
MFFSSVKIVKMIKRVTDGLQDEMNGDGSGTREERYHAVAGADAAAEVDVLAPAVSAASSFPTPLERQAGQLFRPVSSHLSTQS